MDSTHFILTSNLKPPREWRAFKAWFGDFPGTLWWSCGIVIQSELVSIHSLVCPGFQRVLHRTITFFQMTVHWKAKKENWSAALQMTTALSLKSWNPRQLHWDSCAEFQVQWLQLTHSQSGRVWVDHCLQWSSARLCWDEVLVIKHSKSGLLPHNCTLTRGGGSATIYSVDTAYICKRVFLKMLPVKHIHHCSYCQCHTAQIVVVETILMAVALVLLWTLGQTLMQDWGQSSSKVTSLVPCTSTGYGIVRGSTHIPTPGQGHL